MQQTRCYEKKIKLANVGFELTPFRTSALNWRLRPLGQLTDRHSIIRLFVEEFKRKEHPNKRQLW